MNRAKKNQENRLRRKNRIRARVSGTSARPRLAVFRSNKFMYAQIIDDTKGVTLAAASDAKISAKGKMARAEAVGKAIAEAAKAKKVNTVVFDRGGYVFTGRVKALAEGARSGGLVF